MMISTRGRYVLRVMIDLAEHIGSSYIPLKDITERQQTSEKYLEPIVKVPVRNGLLDTFRGKGDGYRLNHSPVEHMVGSILRLAEGSPAPVACLEEEAVCERATYCRTPPVRQKLDRLVNGFFDGYTLADPAASNLAGSDFVI